MSKCKECESENEQACPNCGAEYCADCSDIHEESL